MFQILSVCNGGGYQYCRTCPPHPKRNRKGLYPLHRVLVENKLDRLLGDDEEVHHKDGDKTNDSPDNLEVMTKVNHVRHHHPPITPVQFCCLCGVTFALKPHSYRLRKKRAKGPLSCSRSCGATQRHMK